MSRSVVPILYIFSRNIYTPCKQVDSNLVNLEAIVELGQILELLYLTTRW